MEINYRFWIYSRQLRSKQRFQVRVGMSEDRDLECVPAHRTAFALRLSLEESHATEAEAVAEMARLRELIEALWQERNLQAA